MHKFVRVHSWLACIINSRIASRTTDIIYIDFSLDFDGIVYKINYLGLISLKATVSMASYLIGFHRLLKTDICSVENCFSSVAKVISGVPQGSVLGPILFIIFINDIDSVCHSRTNMKLFADDAKLYSEID